MSKPKVTYFDFPGSRGEEVRLALVLAGVDFDDYRVGRAEFARIKPDLPFGTLPTLEVPGHGVLVQTNAILRLIGRLHGLHPGDPWEGARHDAVLEACEDLRQRLSATSRMSDAAEKKAVRQALVADFIPRWAEGIEGLIGEGSFVGGTRPAVADIKIYMIQKALSSGTYDDIPPKILDRFARVQGVAQRIASHPAVLAWIRRA
ncbi:glutathione S-transferase family protein [Aestuariivirga sp.]|uniref:glutathione S-transferase family protein n=1 Tax=Aestuariivirga sp. TaxID=2650926 RepID=UPI003919D2E4